MIRYRKRGYLKRFFLSVLDGAPPIRKVEVFSSITLGRSHGNDLAFSGEEYGIVSARHALVALKGSSLWLRDLDSTNGTFVGKQRVTERELLGGEIIMLGPDGPAMRVEVMDVPDAPSGADTLAAKGRETTTMMAAEVGLFAKRAAAREGNRSMILEMARRLRRTDSPQEVMQGLLRDPERLARLLQGGVMPERVAGWLGGLGSRFARSRRRILWIGGVLGGMALAGLSILGWQNHSYRQKLKRQGDLLAQIHELEQGLDAPAGGEFSPERSRAVHQLLAAERQLFQLRDKLKLHDRASTYRHPLGAEVHQVLEELGKKGFIVPESFIKTVQEQIAYFTAPGNRATLGRCFARKPRYEALIREELKRKNLPPDFLYIAMQESLLDSLAQSGNDARGLWQLVPETAREFDLQVPEDWKQAPAWRDERTSPRAATRAAAAYLHLLYSEFGDAALAMAAYNAGAGKMRKTLRRIEDPVNDRDFWYIYRMGFMSAETRAYVPKIIAMILIDRDRGKYGFRGAPAPAPRRALAAASPKGPSPKPAPPRPGAPPAASRPE